MRIEHQRRLRVAAGLTVAGIVITVIFFEVFLKVGPVHFRIHRDQLAQIVELAPAERLEPGMGMEMVFVDGQLRPNDSSWRRDESVTLLRRRDGRFFVTIHQPGYTRTQGYVYAEDPAVTQVTTGGFPYVESTDFERVDDRWWSYVRHKY